MYAWMYKVMYKCGEIFLLYFFITKRNFNS